MQGIDTPELHAALLKLQARRTDDHLRAQLLERLLYQCAPGWVLMPYDLDLTPVRLYGGPEAQGPLVQALRNVKAARSAWAEEPLLSGWTEKLQEGMTQEVRWSHPEGAGVWELRASPLQIPEVLLGGLLWGQYVRADGGAGDV